MGCKMELLQWAVAMEYKLHPEGRREVSKATGPLLHLPVRSASVAGQGPKAGASGGMDK